MLTGKVRARLGWLGRLVLQVQVQERDVELIGGYVEPYTRTFWRDAKVEDMTRVLLHGSRA